MNKEVLKRWKIEVAFLLFVCLFLINLGDSFVRDAVGVRGKHGGTGK